MNKTSMWLQSFNSEKKWSDHNHEKYVQKLQGKTIAVTGGKGGVGKTSITLKMAKDNRNDQNIQIYIAIVGIFEQCRHRLSY